MTYNMYSNPPVGCVLTTYPIGPFCSVNSDVQRLSSLHKAHCQAGCCTNVGEQHMCIPADCILWVGATILLTA